MESEELIPHPVPEQAAVPSVSETFEAQIKDLIEYLIEAKKKLANKLLGEPTEDEVKVGTIHTEEIAGDRASRAAAERARLP
jgi:hypothetical protein